jgi:GNAT superfamily N-acetyltransferase
LETIKYIEYDKRYLEEINCFINESMHKFINRPYKIRKDVANIEKYYLKNDGNFWIAIDTTCNKIVGTLALEKRKDIGIVKRFYIQEEYQNRKIGTNLYSLLEEYSKRVNIRVCM